MVEME